MMITSQNFPTPDLALRTHDAAKLAQIRAFADHQVAAAQGVLDTLQTAQFLTARRDQRRPILLAAFRQACAWRYEVALKAPRPAGDNDVGVDPERFRTTLSEGGVNYDRLGDFGRLRDGSTWDARTRTYVGGQITPASVTLGIYGELARTRIAEHGQDGYLQNYVTLPGGLRVLNGNRLVSGQEAEKVAQKLLTRMADRGLDVSRVETGGDPVYAITAQPHEADILRNIAFVHLVGAVELRDLRERIEAWQLARYLMYQGPLYKKGSDAVNRVFLVAIGAALFDAAPMMQQDTDLRCMVLAQRDALAMPADATLYASAIR
jgi:hypothetical protein